MKRRLLLAFYELRILPWPSYLLVLVALLLLGLTHGVFEEALRWRKHYIENMESFFPLAISLVTTPLILTDIDQGMTELNADFPQRQILHLRFAVVWGLFWLVSLMGIGLMNGVWGPVAFWSGLLAAVGPALFLTGLALWGTLYSGRIVVGYLVALGLSAADLILKIMGAFSQFPWLQLIDTFAYRWNVPSMPWWIVKIVMGIIGIALIEFAIRSSARRLSNWL